MAICFGNHDSGLHMPPWAVFGWCFPAWPRPIFFCAVYTVEPHVGHHGGIRAGDLGRFCSRGGVCASYTAQGHILMVFIGLVSPPLFFRAVYTAGAHARHLKDMWMGDFGVILSVEGVFVSHMLSRVVFGWCFPAWPRSIFFLCSVYCGGCYGVFGGASPPCLTVCPAAVLVFRAGKP